jgi:hypothetical protein
MSCHPGTDVASVIILTKLPISTGLADINFAINHYATAVGMYVQHWIADRSLG